MSELRYNDVSGDCPFNIRGNGYLDILFEYSANYYGNNNPSLYEYRCLSFNP